MSIVIIQNEEINNGPYTFVDEKLIITRDKEVNKLIDDKVMSNKNLILLVKNDEFRIEIKYRLSNGYLIEGMLNETDELGRRMTFTCYYNKRPKDFKMDFHTCLNKINKSINDKHIDFISETLKKYHLYIKMVIGFVGIGVIYLIVK